MAVQRHPPRFSKPAYFTRDASPAQATAVDFLQGVGKSLPKDLEKALEQGGNKLIASSVSAVQTVASQGGVLGQAGGAVLGGLASGGLAGGAVAAAQQAATIGLQFEGAGRDAQLNAPLFTGRGRGEFERQFGKQEFVNEARRGIEKFNDLNDDTGGVLGFAIPGLNAFRGSGNNATEDSRRSRELHEFQTRPVDRTTAEVGGFVGEIAALGGNVSDDQIRQLGAARLRQNRAREVAEERTAKIMNVLGGFSDPHQSGQGAHH